jgi:hypothetical protein
MNAIRILLMFCFFQTYQPALAETEVTEVSSRKGNIQASLRVISFHRAAFMWNNRDASTFFSDREINEIAFRAFSEARSRGLSQAGDIGRLTGALIRSYQGNDFDGWRARVGEFLILGQGTDAQGIAGQLFNLLGAIDVGDIVAIIQQIIALIQLFG